MIETREATSADIAAICALGDEVDELHRRARRHISAAKAEPECDQACCLAGIGREMATTFVAEDDGRLVASVTVSIADEVPSLLVRCATERSLRSA